MNVELLEKVKKHILEEPRRLNMSEWKTKVDTTLPRLDHPPCGTIGCIAGWAVILSGLEMTDPGEIELEAIRLLSLSLGQSADLFYRQYWPIEFSKDWVLLDQQERVDRTIARIDHMIATGK